jgi:hypothetical protein
VVVRTTVLIEDHTNAILEALSAAPFPIGDGVAPRGIPGDTKAELEPPYSVLYELPGGRFDGPLNDSQGDTTFVYQITSVGTTRQQAAVCRDICRGLMKRENLIITDRYVRDLKHLSPSSGTVRDDDLANPLFYAYDRYELDTTPS